MYCLQMDFDGVSENFAPLGNTCIWSLSCVCISFRGAFGAILKVDCVYFRCLASFLTGSCNKSEIDETHILVGSPRLEAEF